MSTTTPSCRQLWKGRGVRRPPEDPCWALPPPAVGRKPLPVNDLPRKMQNKFLRELYLKYPFLMPKELPDDQPDSAMQRAYTARFEDLSTYQETYGHMGPELPELVRARGQTLPEAESPTVRLPGVPYLSRGWCPLWLGDAVDKQEVRRNKLMLEKQKALQMRIPLPKRITEYEANINENARKWMKLKVYSEPTVYIRRKETLPPEFKNPNEKKNDK